MMMDGFDLIGSSKTTGRLIFMKYNFTVTFTIDSSGVSVTVCKTDEDGKATYKFYDRLEYAIQYVNMETRNERI